MGRTFLISLALFTGTILAGSATTVSASELTDDIVAPGVLDLPVIKGSFIPEDCDSMSGSIAESILVGCVAYSLKSEGADGKDWDSEYVSALEDSGWIFAGGAANVYYLERNTASRNCRDQMSLVFWLLGDQTEIAKYGTEEEREIDWEKIPYGVIFFFLDKEPTCDITE